MDISKTLKLFRTKKILVIGDLMLDRYIWGSVSRISPEAPVPVVDVESDSVMLGGAANVANNIVSLGGKATIVGIAGRDREAGVLEQLLAEASIESRLIRDNRPTSVKTRVIAHSQQVVRFDMENTEHLTGSAMREMLGAIAELLPHHDAVIVSDYRKGVVTAQLMKALLKAAKKKFVAVDPKVGHFHLYKGVSLITPNLKEASEGSGIEIKDLQTLLKAGRTLLSRLRLGALLVTRGKDGMSLFDGGKVTHIPTMARKVFDVTGAGDTVIAAFCLAYSSGLSMEEAAMVANHAAGIVVGEVGTAVATPELLRKSFRAARG